MFYRLTQNVADEWSVDYQKFGETCALEKIKVLILLAEHDAPKISEQNSKMEDAKFHVEVGCV